MTTGPDFARRPRVYDSSIATPRGGMVPGADSAELLSFDDMPWFQWIDGLNQVGASVGWNTAHAYNATWPLLGLSWTTPAAGVAVGSSIWWDFWVAPGTYTLQVPIDNRNDYPIVQYDVDGTNIGPTYDRYAATRTVSQHVITGIVLAYGWHRFKSKIVGKNAASSAYTHVFCGACLIRTA